MISPVIDLAQGLRPGGRFDDWSPRPVRGVFLDCDGTTVGTRTEPSAAVVEACRSLGAAGMTLGFATGRPPAGVRALRRIIGPTGPDVVHNGAQVLGGGTPVGGWPVPVRTARRLARWCLDRGAYAEFAIGSGYVVTEFREAARPSWTHASGDPDGLLGDVDLAGVETLKITVYAFEPELLPELTAVCRTLDVHVDPSTAPLFPGVTIVNVTAAGVTKGRGVEWAARRSGLDPAELLVVGDSENDLSMLDVAGTAVAMGQASDEIKAHAHLVTGTLDDDGVVTALSSCLGRV